MNTLPISLLRYCSSCGSAAISTPAPANPTARVLSSAPDPCPVRESTTSLVSHATAIGAIASTSMIRT
ncbi:hypothetical protein ACFQGX_18365 [Nonomuraea dietziae]|uniref:hypothetical protein n=1 Tax=Nonomuraea dietziae TaxID=65515 RepID=UPI003620489E